MTRNLIIAVLPLLAALICLGIGRYSLDVRETVKILFSGLTGYEPDPTGYTVIFNVRLPRILLAILVGEPLFRDFFPIHWRLRTPLAWLAVLPLAQS